MTPQVQPSSSTFNANSETSSQDDRRRRPRVDGKTIGWLISDDKSAAPWEVRILDVSRQGVGFESSEAMQVGQTVKIRIGRGPVELARPIKIVNCQTISSSTFRIGGEFIKN
jgi:hypothetical protein